MFANKPSSDKENIFIYRETGKTTFILILKIKTFTDS